MAACSSPAVEHDGPALHAGVHAGDMVVALNGDHIDSARTLIRAVAAMPPGHAARLTVRRQGHEHRVARYDRPPADRTCPS